MLEKAQSKLIAPQTQALGKIISTNKHMYHFANVVNSKDGSEGREPELPDYITSFSARYPGKGNSSWCLCDSIIDDELESSSLELDRVSDKLEILLDSAKLYPPAFAIAFHNANLSWPITKQEYEQKLITLLRKYLSNQHSDSFLLCEANSEQIGYLEKGEFVWVVRFYPESDEVLWVSSDYELYKDSILKFNLKADLLQKLATK